MCLKQFGEYTHIDVMVRRPQAFRYIVCVITIQMNKQANILSLIKLVA